MNGREARTGSASEKFGGDVRARNAQSTFDKPLACVTGIFDHAFGKPLTWIADKFTCTFDPLLTASKGISKEHLWYAIYRRSQVSKNGLYCLWCASKVIKSVQRWPLQNLWPHIWCAVKAIFRAVKFIVISRRYMFPGSFKRSNTRPYRQNFYFLIWFYISPNELPLKKRLIWIKSNHF